MAAEMAVGYTEVSDRMSYSLSKMQRNKRGKGKSGRKKPRPKDYDYDVNGAPDSLQTGHETPVGTAPKSKAGHLSGTDFPSYAKSPFKTPLTDMSDHPPRSSSHVTTSTPSHKVPASPRPCSPIFEDVSPIIDNGESFSNIMATLTNIGKLPYLFLFYSKIY